HRGLFAADVSARAAVHENVEVVARSGGVLAQQASVVGLGHGREQRLGLADELAADVDVSRPRAHREAGYQRAFDQLVRIVADDLAILARTRLGLVGIDHQEARATVLALLRHERPLHASREPRPAAAPQTRRLDLVDDPVLADFHQRLGVVPIAALL